ncbi:MAG: PhnD/SsuA/transferrin family substrate-binding protein, partial [Pseudomonadota bacterium]
FVTLDQACKCVEAVAVPRDQEGALGVFAVLLAPRDGAVRSLSDLKGRVLAVPREPATTTRAVPLAQLAVQGFGEPGALGTLRDVDNPVDGWRLVLNGEADAVMGWSSLQGEASTGYSLGTLNHLIEQTGLAERDDIRVVWTSRIVPHGPHVIRTDLPTELKETIKRFLLDLKNTDILAYDAVEPHLSGGFSEVGPNDFIALTRVVTGQGQ